MLRPPTITDAAGRSMPLAHRESLVSCIADPARRDRLARAGRLEVRLTARDYILPVLLVIPLVILIALVPVATTFWLKLPAYAAIAAGSLSGFIMPISLIYVMRRTASRHIAATYFAAHICPSCGYDLDAIIPTSDDLRTCPECGGVWKLASRD